MARASYAQSSFQGGEWSLTSQGRFELPTYRTSMAVCLNGLPLEEGAWTRAPGSLYETHTRGGVAGRLITWSFKQSLPYTIEFTNGFMRFHTGTRPAMTNDQQAVLAISTANPAVVHTGTHGWTTGGTVMFNTWGTNDPLILNRQFVATVTDSTHFSLTDALTGATIDGSTLATFVSGNVTRIAELGSPYTTALWPSVQSVQAELQSVLLQTTIAPQVLSAAPPTSSADATFSVNAAQFIDGPYNDPVGLATLTPASTSGTIGFTVTAPAWSAGTFYKKGDMVSYSSLAYQSLTSQNLSNQPDVSPSAWQLFLTSDQLGRHIRLFSEPPAWAVGTTYAASTGVKYNNAYWSSIVGSNVGNQPGLDATKWALNPKAATWAWGKISSLTGAVSTMVSAGAGTIIQNASGGWTTNAVDAFDGITVRTWNTTVGDPGIANCGLTGAPTNTYIGKNFGGQTVSYVLVYGPSNVGFSNVPQTITCNLYGKATAPANATDGTLLGSTTVSTSATGEIVQVNSNDTATSWTYLWVQFTLSTNAGAVAVAQIQFFTVGAFSGIGLSATLDANSPTLLYTTVFPTWRLGLFTPNTGYPACGTYHESRLWLSGLVSNRVDASAFTDINGNPATTLFYFTPTLADGTVSDACAIDYTLDGPDVNAIFWAEPDLQGLIFGTQAGEWLMQATTINAPLSPLNAQAHRVTKIGCANILPRRTEHTLVFVQTYLTKVKEYFADIFSGKFTAPNLLEKAAHLGGRRLAELAYQKELSPIVWARMADGSLIGASYKRDTLMTSQGPTFIGWFRRNLGSGRVVESIATGPTASGNLETLGMITNDTGTGIRHVEFMTPNFIETSLASAAWFVDDAVVATTTQGVTSGSKFGMTCSGLWHLNGKTCSVVCGGYDCGDFAVSGGQCFVPYDAICTQTFATAAPQTLVGFTYNSDGQLVRAIAQQESGARTGPALGKKRRTDHVAWLFVQTQGIKYGVTFANDAAGNTQLQPANFATPGGTPYAVNALYSGVWWDTLKGGDDFDSMICWRISRPYPATIAAIEGWLDTKDA